ncbi:MAG: succinylarginine dihydrolase [Planctomycetota bacterium]|nr:MAG: succinylarginine dihydrolase [Planctomycetota bacterium]
MISELVSLPGPSHHYAGYAPGNLASASHAGATSHPRAAVQQCLARMHILHDLGVQQWFLPPLLRPDRALLAAAGLSGNLRQQLTQARDQTPEILSAAWSSASMWTANLGTAAPAPDRASDRAGLLLANLAAASHRAIEWQPRLQQLRACVIDDSLELIPALPPLPDFHDEGGANHTRLADADGQGLHIFVHSRDGKAPSSQRFRGRQPRCASHAAARRLGIPADNCLFVAQHPAAVDAGVFHNDVIMVGQGNRLLLHARAWWEQEATLEQLTQRLPQLRVVCIDDNDLSLDEAIHCYLFNSQLIHVAGRWHLLAPQECAGGRARMVVDSLLDQGFIDHLHICDLRQSMDGGGGPACLRLRVPDNVRFLPQLSVNTSLITSLDNWAHRHYPESLRLDDLASDDLVQRCRAAHDDLCHILDLPSVLCDETHA